MVERLANVVEIEVASQRPHVLLVTVGEHVRNKIRRIGNRFVRRLVPDGALGERQQFGVAGQGLHGDFPRRWRTGSLSRSTAVAAATRRRWTSAGRVERSPSPK